MMTHQIWKRTTFVERSGPPVDARCCSTVPYGLSLQFLFQHTDGFLPGRHVDRLPKITEGVAVLVFIRDGLPQTKAGCFASVANGKRHDLACSSAHRCPQPPCAGLFCSTKLHTSSSSSTSSGDAGRSVSLTSGRFSTCALIHRATVCRVMAKMRSTPRKLQRSRQARSTVCCSVSE